MMGTWALINISGICIKILWMRIVSKSLDYVPASQREILTFCIGKKYTCAVAGDLCSLKVKLILLPQNVWRLIVAAVVLQTVLWRSD